MHPQQSASNYSAGYSEAVTSNSRWLSEFLFRLPLQPCAPVMPTLSAAFVDENLPDGTHLQPGTKFIKHWRMKNTGNVKWSTDTKVFFPQKCEDEWFEVAECSANKLAFFLLSLFISAQVHVGKPNYGFDRKEGCFGPLPQGWPCGNCVCGVHCPSLGGNIHFPLAAFSQRPAVWTSGLVQYHSRSSLLHRKLW